MSSYTVTVEWPAIEAGVSGTVEAMDFEHRPDALGYALTLMGTAQCERPDRVYVINNATGLTQRIKGQGDGPHG